jgi:hypothetical protein
LTALINWSATPGCVTGIVTHIWILIKKISKTINLYEIKTIKHKQSHKVLFNSACRGVLLKLFLKNKITVLLTEEMEFVFKIFSLLFGHFCFVVVYANYAPLLRWIIVIYKTTGCIKKLNRFEIALNFAKQLVESSFCYI